MPNDRTQSENKAPISPKVGLLDVAAKKLLSTVDTSYNERQLLSDRDSRVQSILNRELELAKGVSKGSIIDFVTTMSKESAKHNGSDPDQIDSYNMFTQDVGNLFGYFQQLYKNRYIELADLKFITKFIPAIGEAVKVTLDSITSADDFSTSVTRNLEYGPTLTAEERAQVEAEVKRIEKDEKLLKKLRNVVYRKALVGGNHYVYCIPYAELFTEYDRLVKEGKIRDNMLINQAIARNSQNRVNQQAGFVVNASDKKLFAKYAKENYTTDGTASQDDLAQITASNFDPAAYQIITEAMAGLSDLNLSRDTTELVQGEMMSAFEQCFVADTDVLVEALEGFSSAEYMKKNLRGYRELFAGNAVLEDGDVKLQTTDATAAFNMNGKPEKFKTQGSYIKYIDANKLVPVKIYNQIVGYFHVHDMSAKKKASAIATGIAQTNILATSSNIFSTINMADDSRLRATQAIVDAVSDGIIMNFSKKFVNKNVDFKRLIADCIVANGFVNTAFQIQFIPAKYIVSFSVNEDEDGMGQSILVDALFPAKMLLSVLVSKLLLYMNKSGNKTIAYIRKGPLDRLGSNQIQRVIRMMQESNITFSDLLSTNLSFAKFSRYGSMTLPMAKNGDRLIDLETQEGQEVDLHTPMEEYLEKLSIIGTGVPSVIMEYTDAADYAKSIVTANIKFAGRVASLQADLEEPTTELYKKLLETSSLDEDVKKKVIPSFEFKLCRPRVLTNINMSDYIQQMEQLTRSISNLFLGENDADDDATELRRRFIQLMASEFLPFVTWDEFEALLEKAKVEMAKDKDLDSGGDNLGGDEDFDEGM